MLRCEINRWDRNMIDVGMMAASNCKIKRELQHLQNQLQQCKEKCEDLTKENIRLRKKIRETRAAEEEIEKFAADGGETRHMEGNEDKDILEAINSNLINSDQVSAKLFVDINRTTPSKTSPGQLAGPALVESAKQPVGTVMKTNECDNREEPKETVTPCVTNDSSENHSLSLKKDELNRHMMSDDFDSGTLMRDASQEETVLVEAVKISSNLISEFAKDSNATSSRSGTPEHTSTEAENEEKCINTMSELPLSTVDPMQTLKPERRLPKIPFTSAAEISINNLIMKEDALYGGMQNEQNFGTLETVSTKSFGFSRPSNTFIRKEREQGILQYHACFYGENPDNTYCFGVQQPKSLKKSYESTEYRTKGTKVKEDIRTKQQRSLLRSKSLDVCKTSNPGGSNVYGRRVSVGRAMSHKGRNTRTIDNVESSEDWIMNTPFLKERRRGRRENRNEWGMDGRGILLMGKKQNIHSHLHSVEPNNSFYIAPKEPVQVKHSLRRNFLGFGSSPTPSDVSTNTVVRMGAPHQNILEQEAGMY